MNPSGAVALRDFVEARRVRLAKSFDPADQKEAEVLEAWLRGEPEQAAEPRPSR